MTEWDPNSAYSAGGLQPGDPRVGGPPARGETTPPYVQEQFTDPLISPNYNGWWSRGVSIAKRGWKPLAALQAVGVVLALLVQAPVAAYSALASEDLNQALGTSDPDTPPNLAPLFGLFGLTLLAALLAIILSTIVTIATVHVGVSVAIRAQTRIVDALRLAVRRVVPLLGWQLLAIPIYLIALCLCVLPVFYVAAVFTVLPVVVAVERTSAISRCFSLFHRDLGSSVARIATILGLSIAATVVGGVIGAVIDTAARAASLGTVGIVGGSIVSTLLAALIGGAIAILLAPLTLTAYADMRARVERLDTVVIAQELGIVPPAAQP
jgi:hypothetical protein